MSELLSPAGSLESFYAAISAGADAIYLGLDKFSARAYANNFNLESLEELIKYAHLRKVKINVTINTIIYDDELEEVFATIDQLARMNVDAIIVQDLAVLHYITSRYQSLKAHASTQMGIDDIYGAKFIKDLNASRIVFARETPFNVIKDIKEKLQIEVEAFIHGALCVSYSGNCLMSSSLGERSGNRGRCAGCCRKSYSLYNATNNEIVKTGYLLSLKDLNTSHHIKDMSFIDSLKIEGRMKEPSYVYQVTNLYRKLLDQQKINFDDFNKVFNRSYTDGFIFDNDIKEMSNIIKPNNVGEKIGEVIKQNNDKVLISLDKPLYRLDQIYIIHNNKEISLPINNLYDEKYRKINESNTACYIECKYKVSPHDLVYKTKDTKLLNQINEGLKNKTYRRFDLDIFVSAKKEEPLLIKGTCDGYTVTAKSNCLLEKAKNNPVTKDNIYQQINKLNDTVYQINKFDIECDDDIFIPLKEINELRRELILKMDNKRLEYCLKATSVEEIKVQKHQLFNQPKIVVKVSNKAQYDFVKSLGIEEIYFDNIVHRNHTTFIDDKDTLLIGGYNSVKYYQNKNKYLISDYSFNVVNHLTAGLLSSLGISRITLSNEIDKNHINLLVNRFQETYHTDPNLELIIYGRNKLMHNKYCPLKRLDLCPICRQYQYYLKDDYASFMMVFNQDCTHFILNSKVTNLIDDISSLKGINYYRLEFYDETNEEIKYYIESAYQAIKGIKTSTFNPNKHTRGHYKKNPL